MHKVHRLQSGFSLIEIVIVLAIIALITVFVTQFETDYFQFNTFFSGRLQAIDQARKLLRPMNSEIRGAADSMAGDFALETTDENELVFYANIDADSQSERVRYTLTGGILERGVTEPVNNSAGTGENGWEYPSANEVVTTYIDFVVNDPTEPVFEYFDENYDGTGSALIQPVNVSDVRIVKITLYVDASTGENPGRAELTTQTAIRNLKTNL